jgi:hypothetical protein
MATIRLGIGEEYEGRVIAATPSPTLVPQEHDSLYIICDTGRGDDQKNFPISLHLTREESLKLIKSMCNALLPQEWPEVSRVDLVGEDILTA